jgi:hypothetical protein
MQNPIDVLSVHPNGAAARRLDPRDYTFSPLEVAEASAPFAWIPGTGPDKTIDALLPTKNQGASGSCGGQAVSYYGEVIRYVYAGDGAQRSAKYPYSQVFAPGGGSNARDLANIAIKQGFALESDCPSYQAGFPPTEAFMERPQDITPVARIGAAKDQASMAYAFPTIELDSVAQAASACLGILLAISGTNNGTWLSSEPKPPTPQDFASGAPWRHFMYARDPQIYNGKKGLWAKQSWGAGVGLNGWQFLDEDYFAAGGIWDAMVLIYNSAPVAPPHYTFAADLKLGDTGPAVTALQQYLAYDGEFNLSPTGTFGPITANALLRFQLKYSLSSVATLDELGGEVCGPATRAKLNALV